MAKLGHSLVVAVVVAVSQVTEDATDRCGLGACGTQKLLLSSDANEKSVVEDLNFGGGKIVCGQSLCSCTSSAIGCIKRRLVRRFRRPAAVGSPTCFRFVGKHDDSLKDTEETLLATDAGDELNPPLAHPSILRFPPLGVCCSFMDSILGEDAADDDDTDSIMSPLLLLGERKNSCTAPWRASPCCKMVLLTLRAR